MGCRFRNWDIVSFKAPVPFPCRIRTSGNPANSANFDPENIEQFGFVEQWTDTRGMASLFGTGTLVDEDGNAVIPDHWREAIQWYYAGIWDDHFIPSETQINSDLMGNPFSDL